MKRASPPPPSPPMLLYSIFAIVGFLLLDALVGGQIEHQRFEQNLFSFHDMQEWWMRSITITIILAFGIFSQKVFRRQNNLLRELDRSKSELQLLIESASEGILFLGSNEQVQLANPAICQLTGYSSEQLQQGDLHSLIRPHLADGNTLKPDGNTLKPDGSELDPDHCPLCHLNPEDRSTQHIPHLLLTTSRSTTVSTECWVRAVHNSDDQFEGWLATIIDVGRRIAAEQQSQQLLEDLQREQAILHERNEELQHFAYVASHDLQEPLRMVSSFVQLLDRRYSNQLDASAKEFIGFAVDGTSRMQQMINDLLNFSRIGSQATPLEPLALQPLIDAAIANLKVTIDNNKSTITVTPTDSVILSDQSQIIRLFQNLIGNAIKFQPEGQAANITIDISGNLTITISDNGIGIPPAYHSMVFEVFKRLHGRDKYSGSGIGLAVCRRIVSRHNGTLTIAEQPENQPGSTFVITLPQATLPQATIETAKESEP